MRREKRKMKEGLRAKKNRRKRESKRGRRARKQKRGWREENEGKLTKGRVNKRKGRR